jgi:hypothetical protein
MIKIIRSLEDVMKPRYIVVVIIQELASKHFQAPIGTPFASWTKMAHRVK